MDGILQLLGSAVVVAGIILILFGIFEKPNLEYNPEYERNYSGYYSGSDYSKSDESELDELDKSEFGNIGQEYLYESNSSNKKTRTEFGGVVMIGPIPIVFGNNSRMATIAIVLTLLLMILGFLMIFMSYRGI